jgi:hypothetical protein
VGNTTGTFPGQTATSGAYVRKYDAAGNELWTRQFGGTQDTASSVAVGASGIAVAGATTFGLPGQTNAGSADAYVRLYDASGNELWTRQFGSTGPDVAYTVAMDGNGNIYVGGLTNGTLPGQTGAGNADGFVRKYDASGNAQWTQQFGTGANDSVHGAAADALGNVYVAGYTSGTLPGQTSAGGDDAYVRKYDPSGAVQWTRQFGSTALDGALSVSVDANANVYVGGYVGAALAGLTSAGADDAFVVKFDTSGTTLWTREFGTSASEGCEAVSVDASGDVYCAGYTAGALPNQTSAGGEDAFVRKYDSAGTEQWTTQFGSSANERALGVCVGGSAVYAAGDTFGTLPGQTSAGSQDAFVARFAP